ncbi:glucosamine inositolphosphorylceramide transferase 1 [Punica granatum]|uniref:Glucosamine inositolphosphorylceramide transferase 1 n=2 Tax=Punica granatum TaxID=22663 RepID=A0A2I0KJA5_PUNGR|nr:glucosamine inositolphosphorylceramide transferase 1 [Punica granatum]PKI68571.1 hypothetical protein CRG98_011057 [Punica granatum]
MGIASTPIAANSPLTSVVGAGPPGCCVFSLRCWCRWRCHDQPSNRVLSSCGVFFLGCLALFGSIGTLYAWLAFKPPYVRAGGGDGVASLGCREDSEGSWSVGVFYGDSPLALKPIETVNMWRDQTAAWPVANPVVTCASMSDAGFPSNFVADPFIYLQEDNLYLFYETKNSITMQGDIGVAKSTDKGATWEPLGIALDEDWHLSYPYVFEYQGQIYMMPESSGKGDLRIYSAVNFPLQWKLEKIIMKKPLVDAFIINHNGMYWLFGSDHTGFGARKNGQLEIWYSNSPLGPWIPHKRNPIYNTEKSVGARNGGRPFVYNGDLYRVGQDSGETYGRRVRVFKVEMLTKNEYREVEVSLGIEEPAKGRNAWNGARYHHLDAQQLPSGEWIAVMDGDRVPSGDSVLRFIFGVASVMGVAAIIILMGAIVGAVKCIIPLNWCSYGLGKKGNYNSSALWAWERDGALSSKVWWLCTRLNRAPSLLRGWVRTNTCMGKFILAVIFSVGAVLMCNGVKYIYGGNGAQEAYPLKGQHSQFTLLTMTYDARLWNLKMYVKHYSRCSSVKEIVVVWNKGIPPKLTDFDSAVPVRIRVEGKNSLNNRFKVDSLITTRAVLELDDDIMMTCDDVERGFNVWRQHPDRIVGFYPRLVAGSPLKYRAEKFARAHGGYNMILTGAAFMDLRLAFQRYWSAEAKAGRELVDEFFNCEDVLLNYLYANASSSLRTVEYVRPAWAIDTSKFSGAAISRNTQVHYGIRSKCLVRFSEMYGGLGGRKWEFNGRKDGWDL